VFQLRWCQPGQPVCRGETGAGGTAADAASLHTLEQLAAQELNQRRTTIAAGDRSTDAQADGGSAEVRYALQIERRRLRAELREVMNGGPDDAASRDDATFQVDQAGEVSAADRDTRAEEIRDAIGRVGVRLEAAEADLCREAGDLVLRGAALRHELNEDWWNNANPGEVAGVWNQVQEWSPGQARDRALDNLRQGMVRNHGVDIDRDATPMQVLRHVHRGRAESRGERPYGYRIEEVGLHGPERAARFAVQGRTSAPEGDSPQQVAQGLMDSYAGDLDKARAQKLRVVLRLSADDLPEGIVGKDGDEPESVGRSGARGDRASPARSRIRMCAAVRGAAIW
jgi:hypothetical protein